jgi:sugar phosphate isomerase/epimerase
MIEEILALGFTRVELGYDTRYDLVQGIRDMVQQGAVIVDSLHNFCPVPIGTSKGHPEIYTFASSERRVRERAVKHTIETIRFAAELGARTVVSHSGNVEMTPMTNEIRKLVEEGKQYSNGYDRLMRKLQARRDRRAAKQLPFLFQCLEQMVPTLLETGVELALEILPTWEAFPTETEFEEIFQHFGPGPIRYWHDIGHAQIRENLGFIRMERWLEKLGPHLAGMHLHDVRPPGRDHLMPPDGAIEFSRYAEFGRRNILRVLEPRPGTPPEIIVRGRDTIAKAWS